MDAVVATIRRIEPRADRGALVSIRELRGAGITDEAILAGARAGLLALHRHDWPAQYSAEEKAAKLLQVGADYYCAAAIRQS